MNNWKQLDVAHYTRVWDFVYKNLDFKPYNEPNSIINVSSKSLFFDISEYYNEGFKEELYENLHCNVLNCFREIHEDLLYALNWQHDCYSFSPNQPFELDEFGEWIIPVFPNGDYIFFLTKSLEEGIFADGINCSIVFFGERLIDSLMENMPKMFIKKNV